MFGDLLLLCLNCACPGAAGKGTTHNNASLVNGEGSEAHLSTEEVREKEKEIEPELNMYTIKSVCGVVADTTCKTNKQMQIGLK